MPKSTKPPAFAGFDAVRPAHDAGRGPDHESTATGIAGLPAGVTAAPKHPAHGKTPHPKRMTVKPAPLPRRTGG